MRTSDEINELAAALAKAQGEIEDASKDSKNQHFNSRYADLASVRAAIRGPASKHGLAYVQFVRATSTHVEVETMLLHASGQYLAETLPLPVVPDKTGRIGPQVFGSAATYARRYGLMGMFGIAPSEDDGEAAMTNGKLVNAATMVDPRSGPPISDEQADTIRKKITDTKSDVEAFCGIFGAPSVPDIPAASYDEAIRRLDLKQARLDAAKAKEAPNGHA